MNPKAEALKKRAHDFFVRVMRLCDRLPKSITAESVASQLVDSAGSADSNYGCACKGRTRRQFVDKVGLAAEEANESQRWLEALRDAGIGDSAEVECLIKEAHELAAIFSASHRTSKQRLEADERRLAAEKEARRSQRQRRRC
jgi:four helix bundle protein